MFYLIANIFVSGLILGYIHHYLPKKLASIHQSLPGGFSNFELLLLVQNSTYLAQILCCLSYKVRSTFITKFGTTELFVVMFDIFTIIHQSKIDLYRDDSNARFPLDRNAIAKSHDQNRLALTAIVLVKIINKIQAGQGLSKKKLLLQTLINLLAVN